MINDSADASEAIAIVARWRQVLADLRRDASDCDRRADAVELVCVSKGQPIEVIEPLLAAGARVFGENRVQEAQSKWPELRRRYPDLSLHLIGPLQTNKVDEALDLFDVIEVLDRPKLAETLAKRVSARGSGQPGLFVQVNTGAEPQKSGVTPGASDAFIGQCRDDFGLAVSGLMCIPPSDEPAAPHFALLAQIAARNGLRELSMGMSADYGVGVQLGATFVRIGTAIFGERRKPRDRGQ